MKYDAIVVGAGPGGSTAATMMARHGLNVLMLDKDTFPRDKICGDAISGKSVDLLKELGILNHLERASESIDVWGVAFSGTKGDFVDIPLTQNRDRPNAPGFVCTRFEFDQLVFQAAVDAGVEIWQEATVKGLLRNGKRVTGVTVKRKGEKDVHTIHAPLVIGADGAYSVVVRDLGMDQLNPKHYCGAIRAYYENIGGFQKNNSLEIHFVDEVIPGYFWIFPLPDGRANVGVGMLSETIKKRGVKLKALLDDVVQAPLFKERFANARRVGPIKGFGLPLGSKPRPMAGDGWMLVGDAASLIDPFTGEGIGNAMLSGERAAAWAKQALDAGTPTKAFLKAYETEVIDTLRSELRLSHAMQKLLRHTWLLNLVIRKASRSKEVADAMTCMFDDLSERSRLISPMFYLRLLAA